MEDVYRFEIRQLYLKKKKLGILSTNLLTPTTSKLKRECLLLLEYGYCKTDLHTFKSFFCQYCEENIDIEKCQYFSTDKFRSLLDYLKKENIKTDIKNIELLAILIDFKPRPYKNFLHELQKQRNGDNPYLFERDPGNDFFFKQALNNAYPGQVLYDDRDKPDLPIEDTVAFDEFGKICIEYPSGAKIYVNKNEMELISKLVKI